MSQETPYQVIWSFAAQQEPKSYMQESSDLSLKNELANVLKAIYERLCREPLSFGEVYRSKGSIHTFLGFHDSVGVDFAVDTARQLVFVRECRLRGRFAVPSG